MQFKAEEVEVVIKEVIKEDGISIHLNREEAAGLFAILSRVSGISERDDVRKLIGSPLWDALLQVYPDFFKTSNVSKGNKGFSEDVYKYYRTISQGLVLDSPK